MITGIEETEHQCISMHGQSTFLNGALINLSLFPWIPWISSFYSPLSYQSSLRAPRENTKS